MSRCRGRKQFQVPGRAKKPVSLGMQRGGEKGMEDEVTHPRIRFPGPQSQDTEAHTTLGALEPTAGFMLPEARPGF